MKRYLKNHVTGGLICCVVALLLVFAASAQAEHEIALSDVKANVPTDGTITAWTSDVEVEFKKPDMTSTGDILIGFVYKWSISDLAWDGTSPDGTVDPSLDPPVVVKAASFFANDDSTTLRYLYVKTKYFDISAGGEEPVYSSAVRIGAINIDNVAPTGTVQITDSEGTVISSTKNTALNLKLYAATVPVIKMYLSETLTRPVTGVTYATEVVYDLTNTAPGSKTIYAWFEDSVGNISKAPATATVTLLAPVSISPDTATIDVNAGTQVFILQGTAATNYNWSIVDASPADVATITSGSTNVGTITVTAAKEGTFKVQATDGTNTVTSGTITAESSTMSKTFNLITTETTDTNTIGFIFENTGITTAHELGTAVGNCTQVAKWDATTQSYLSHRMQFVTLNNFTLNVGDAYFVTIDSSHDFTLTGTLPASHTQTLITTTTTSTNAVGVPYSKNSITTAHDLGLDIGNCSQVAKWDAATQSFLSHRMQFVTLNNFTVEWGQGYFFTVTQQTDWPW